MNVKLGLENFLSDRLELVAGRRIGLVVSPSSIDRDLSSTINRLYRHPGVQLVALFGPEHGVRGEAQAGQTVGSYIDPTTHLPVYSLYGDTHKPTPEMLHNIDVLIFDMQDGGVRFYTFLATLVHVLQAAAELDVSVIVLDRPTPLGGQKVEGPVLDPAFRSFVGPYPIPIRYGMTMGEIACLFNETFEIGCNLEIVPLSGWKRDMWFDQTGLPFVPPSPNLPTLQSMTVYPGTCLVEAINVSEGRGTTKPFEYIGAPWINAEDFAHRMNALELPGVRFRPIYFMPTFSKYRDQSCQGVHVYVQDREMFRPVEMGIYLLAEIRAMYPEQFSWQKPWGTETHLPIDLLTGCDTVRKHLDAGRPIPELVSGWHMDLQSFCDLRARYLRYPD